MYGQIFAGSSGVRGICEGHKRRRNRVIIGDRLGAILRDEGRQQVKLRGVIVDRWHNLSPEDVREVDQRLVCIQATPRYTKERFPYCATLRGLRGGRGRVCLSSCVTVGILGTLHPKFPKLAFGEKSFGTGRI